MVLGHDLSEGQRTQDIQISEDISFDTMLLKSITLKGLRNAGFFKPSPIQLHGIPLGKCGFDLLLEAKSGTGKTAVFTVIALEKLDLNAGVQAIVLAPTREIASQISDVITAIGSHYKDLNVAVVMGGLPVKDDIEKLKEKVHIVVGSPGRLRHLIHKHIDVSSVRLLVLDEADKLMESSFQPDINYIFSLLPKQKQVIMSSATYNKETRLFISKYVQKAQHICPDSNSVLLGIEQKVTIVPHHSNIVKQTKHRYEELKKILTGKQFKQCLIFCNYQVRVGELHRMLSRDKWPAEQLYGQQQQTDRLDALKTLQEYKCRILVSTDLAARGIDASNVDLVINFEPPFEWQTYLHRIGRAGRYGSYGTAISIISDGKEMTKFKETLGSTKMSFNLQNLWSDEDFNLNISEETLTLNPTPVINSPDTKEIRNDKKEDLLWKILTTETTEQNIENFSEVYSFQGLCESFKIANEPIESFSKLMHSFSINQNGDDKRLSNVEYKHVKVNKLQMDIEHLEIICDKNMVHKSNKLSGDNIPVNNTDHRSKNRNMGKDSLHIVEGFKGKQKQTHSTVNMYKDDPNIPLYFEDDISKQNGNIDLIKQETIQTCRNKSNETRIDLNEPTMTLLSLPMAYGKQKYENIQSNCNGNTSLYNNQIENYSNNKKQEIVKPIIGSKQQSDKTKNNFTEHALTDAGLPTTFDKVKYKVKQKNLKSITAYKEQSEKTEINSTEQALIDAGLPISFGKVKYKGNCSHTINDSYDNTNKNNKNVKLHRPKVQSRSLKFQVNNGLENINNNCYKNDYSNQFSSVPNKVTKSDEYDSSDQECDSTVTSVCKQVTNKSREYRKYALSTLYNAHGSQFSKRCSNSKALHRNQQFDLWYKQLKCHMQFIRYTLYIQELRKL